MNYIDMYFKMIVECGERDAFSQLDRQSELHDLIIKIADNLCYKR